MIKPTLVILAAGMGSRFGGMKQITPIGPNGEFIIDYSVYDAVKAGFGKVVIVIKKEYETQFKETIGNRISRVVETVYAYQELDNLPAGLKAPAGRVKPWGTGHALYCVKGMVNEPFAVINADDFYGYSAYKKVCDFLAAGKPGLPLELCMAGYYIENTLTEHGSVKRGLCGCDQNGYLTDITERIDIVRKSNKLTYSEDGTEFDIPAGTIASMNFFGFMPEALDEVELSIRKTFTDNANDLDKAEVYLPSFVSDLIKAGKATVKILPADEKWYGVTYAEDKEPVCKAIREMIATGMYKEKLWD